MHEFWTIVHAKFGRLYSLAWPIMHPCHISANLHFSRSLRIIEYESVISTGKVWTHSFSLDIFKMTAMNKKPISKNRTFRISISNYHRYTTFISKYIILRVTNMIQIFKKCFLITKGLKIQDSNQFSAKNHS